MESPSLADDGEFFAFALNKENEIDNIFYEKERKKYLHFFQCKADVIPDVPMLSNSETDLLPLVCLSFSNSLVFLGILSNFSKNSNKLEEAHH